MKQPLPNMRTVDALTGDIASPVMGILATADHIHDGLSDAKALREENAALRAQLDALMATDKGELLVRNLELKAENDELHARCAAYSDEVISLRAALDDARRTAKWSAS